MTEVWPDDAARDRLIGDWYLWQRKGGHRTSTDDILPAWLACRLLEGRRPTTYIDIGCGIGSVLLMTAWRLRPHQCWGVEAQAQSAMMARRSVRELPDGAPPIEVVVGDMRSVDVTALPKAELITGSPPYFPVGTGVLSPDPQRQACRFELRGGIEAYCATAARLLAPTGLFTVVFIAKGIPRLEAAADAAGLVETHRVLWRMREDSEHFLSVHALRLAPADGTRPPLVIEDGAVRRADGSLTEEYVSLRELMGLA